MTQYSISNKFWNFPSNPFPVNRWGIPIGIGLMGGGESPSDYCGAVNKGAWNNSNIPNQCPPNVTPDRHKGPDTSKADASKKENTWAHVAGKGLDSIPKKDRVSFLCDVLLSSDGWGKEHVNQDSAWDLPEPEPLSAAHSKILVNNGCELWENSKSSRDQSPKKPEANWLDLAPLWKDSEEWKTPHEPEVPRTEPQAQPIPPKSTILPSPYSLGPFTHKDSGQQRADVNNEIKPRQTWDATKDYSHPQWITMPNDRQSQGMIAQPPLLKPEQLLWPHIPNQDIQPDLSWNTMSVKPKTHFHEEETDNVSEMLKKGNREGCQPLSSLVNQIQCAVQGGYLNYHILNQPLSPNTVILLNQLLADVGTLHKLMQQQALLQPQAHLNKNVHQQYLLVNSNINKLKHQIQYLQNQINSQQALYMRQQAQMGVGLGVPQSFQMAPLQPQPAPMKPEPPKASLPDSLLLNFSQLGIASNDQNWKTAPPVVSTKPQTSQDPYLLAQSSLGHGSVLAPNVVNSQWNIRAKDRWPTSPTSISSHPSNDLSWSTAQSYDLDVRPFEPGKPWLVQNMDGSISHKGNGEADMSHVNDALSPLTQLKPSSAWSYSNDSQRNSRFYKRDENNVHIDNTNRLYKRDENNVHIDNTNRLYKRDENNVHIDNTNRDAHNELIWPSSGNSSDTWNSTSKTKWTGVDGALSPQWSSTWLILRNLTPEIDGSTLKTLCIQHGPLVAFHLFSNIGFALANYGTPEHALKAQSNLNNCLLNNTTILAEFASEAEVKQLISTQNPSNSKNVKPKSDWNSLWPNGSLWGGRDDAVKTYLSDNLLNSETI